MTEQNSAHTEDLALDAEQAEEVVGGRNRFQEAQHEIDSLLKSGWEEESCTPHGTLMKNTHTGQTKLIKG
jgi:hypothetical protein